MRKKIRGRSSKNDFLDLELEYLIDDETNQIIISPTLFKAFDRRSKNKKNYEIKGIKYLFKYVVYLYNDSMQDFEKFGALTYLEKISDCLDYLKISNIIELSLKQLNQILDCKNIDVQRMYKKIVKARHNIIDADFSIYVEMLKDSNHYKANKAKEIFKYISNLYNDNTIIQDNISYTSFLKEMASVKQDKILSMRMYEIIDLCKINNINYENVNESKKLLNDLSEANGYN